MSEQKRCLPPFRLILTAFTLCVLPLLKPAVAAAQPQEADMDELQRSVAIFAGVLRESLELNVRQSVFNPRAGEVSGRYLANQGVVVEMMTPLRSSRNSISLHSLNASLQDLGRQLGDMSVSGMVQRPDMEALRETMALALRQDEISAYYREMLQRLSSMNEFAAADSALRLAAESARSLYNMGEIEAPSFESLTEELAELRARLGTYLAEMEELRSEIRSRSVAQDRALPADEIQQRWQQGLENLQLQLEQLRERAVLRATDLQARSEQVQEAHQFRWRQEVDAFEQRLFAAVCDYGASLRALPDDEYLTVILPGLGAEDAEGRATARIHVLSKYSLVQCQRGEISVDEFVAQAVSYSF